MKSDILRLSGHVRYSPESDQNSDVD